MSRDERTATPLLSGQVIASFGRQFLVETVDGATLECVVPGKKGGVAVGDRVELRQTSSNQGVISRVIPRTSLLYRSDQWREKIIAANVTQVIVVAAVVPSYYEELLSRCLVAAEANALASLIVLNKADLPETAAARERLHKFEKLGYRVLPLSAKEDITPLRPYLAGQTSVLVGQSGMGKSSMINALLPEVQAATREVSQALDSGRHTTTHARLYHLDHQSDIIDSPGMQEFGLHHLTPEALVHAFPEFRPFIGHCRFANCQHLAEPDCAVRSALDHGTIDAQRYAVYQNLRRALEEKQPW